MTLRQTAVALVVAVAIAPSALAHGQDHHEDDRVGQVRQMVDDAETATDPADRQTLMQARMKAMHEQMQSMRGMMGHHDGGNMLGNMRKMQERMDAIQQMMEQMIAQQQMMMMEMGGGDDSPE